MPAWFSAVGGGAGSALVTIGGAVHRPGVYEIALGTPLGDLLQQAGGPTEAPEAILAGGYFGGWIRYQDALDVSVSGPGLRAAGASLGPGILVLVPASACGLAETARVMSYLAGQSAGQCGPCFNGLPALADALWEIGYRGGPTGTRRLGHPIAVAGRPARGLSLAGRDSRADSEHAAGVRG